MARPKVAKRAKRPVYFTVKNVILDETGELVKALVCRSGVDRREMQARNYRAGDEVRAELSKPRNIKFHGLAHRLGTMVAEHIAGFEGLNAHDAIKRLQRESGIQCESQDLELPGVGKITLNVARSIAFDEMDEGDFAELYEGIVRHIRAKYWPTLTDRQIEEFTLLTERDA